jgi:hypothetical protein
MHLGLQSVIVAFRIGACVWDASSRLGGTLDASGQHPSWTAAIVGLTGEEVVESLRKFTEEKVCPHLRILVQELRGGKEEQLKEDRCWCLVGFHRDAS